MRILDILFRKKVPIEKEPVKESPVKESPVVEESVTEGTLYFGGVVVVKTEGGVLSGSITDAGKEKLNAFTRDELMLYFATFLENHTIYVDINIYGRGPLVKAKEFLAFKVLVFEFFVTLGGCKKGVQTKTAQEEVSNGS